MGTIGVLCKQSMSFDLGVSLYGNSSREDVSSAAAKSPKAGRKPRSWDPSDSARAEETTSANLSDIEVTSVDDTSVFLPSTASGGYDSEEKSRDVERAASSSSDPTCHQHRSRSRPGSSSRSSLLVVAMSRSNVSW